MLKQIKINTFNIIHKRAIYLSNNHLNVFKKNKHFQKPYEKHSETIYEKYKENIYYSSFIESNLLKLGYKKNRILDNFYNKTIKNDLFNENITVKSFPISLQYLNENVTNELSTIDNLKLPIKNEENLDTINNKLKSNRKYNESVNLIADIKKETKNWMNDYEYYNEEDENDIGLYGTPDSTVPISKVPCGGCGAVLHCADTNLPGYLPSELFKNRSEKELSKIICQRCHFLKHYNIALDVTVPPEEYIKLISTISNQFGLVILIIDLLDFPCSIYPGLVDILGKKRPIIVVGNKVDLLPKDSKNYLNKIKECLIQSLKESGFSSTNVKHVSLISAATGFGVEELINKLHNIWGYNGDVYLLGCTNVGKSTLFNALLRSDYCKVQARDLVQRATTSPWPGTTLRMLKFPILRPSAVRLFLRTQRMKSEREQKNAESKIRKIQMRSTGNPEYATLIGHIGNTFDNKYSKDEVMDAFNVRHNSGTETILKLDENHKDYVQSKWCYDTPGVIQNDQVLNLLTTEELVLVTPKQMINPRTFLIKPNMTMYLAGLGRLDYLSGLDSIRLTVYCASNLPILICETRKADEIYNELLGTEFLQVPKGDIGRLQKWPGLESSDIICIEGIHKYVAACDILLSSIGWIGVNIPENQECHFKAWTPEKRGIYIRKPSLIQCGVQLKGARIRGSLAYRIGKPFITN